jgi:hypothetical protein
VHRAMMGKNEKSFGAAFADVFLMENEKKINSSMGFYYNEPNFCTFHIEQA